MSKILNNTHIIGSGTGDVFTIDTTAISGIMSIKSTGKLWVGFTTTPIAFTNSIAHFAVDAPYNGTGGSLGGLVVSSLTNVNKAVTIQWDTTNDEGMITANNTGVGVKDLRIQPFGGSNVALGDSFTANSKLDVYGEIQSRNMGVNRAALKATSFDTGGKSWEFVSFGSSYALGSGFFAIQHTGGSNPILTISPTGNMFLGTSITAATAKFHISGSGNTSASYTLKGRSNSNSILFDVRDDGKIMAGYHSYYSELSYKHVFHNGSFSNGFLAVSDSGIPLSSQAFSSNTAIFGTTQNNAGGGIGVYGDGLTGVRGDGNGSGGAGVYANGGNAADALVAEATSGIAGKFFTSGAYAIIVPTNGGRIGFGTSAPDASAKLDISSSTSGLLPPRMNSTQRDAISSPASGLTIYNTTTSALEFYNGTIWSLLGTRTGNILYVSTVGSDTDATRAGHLGDMTKPFLTLEAAKTAAVSGDLIHVFAGTFTVTTTATAGLAKDGVNYYLEPGCIINKATAGDMFHTIGFTIGFNVYGYADFNMTSVSGQLLHTGDNSTYTPFDMTFQARDVSNTNDECFQLNAYDGSLKKSVSLTFRNAISTASATVELHYGMYNINANSIKSTASVTIYQNGSNDQTILNCATVTSTVNTAIYGGFAFAIFNVARCVGLTYGYAIAGSSSAITLNGYTNGILLFSSSSSVVNLNGICDLLRVETNHFFNGGFVGIMEILSGFVTTTLMSTTIPNQTAHGTFSGGISNITIGGVYNYYFSSTGGKLTINSPNGTRSVVTSSTINGGDVTLNGDFVYTVSNSGDYPYNFFAGRLKMTGLFNGVIGDTTKLTNIVKWTGGDLIIDRATFITQDADITPILSLTANQTLRVYSGGMTTNRTENGGTLSAKAQKQKHTVTASADTTILLNDGSGGDETFTALVSGFPTKSALAAQLVSLINASGTLDITATQDTPGTDEYFYIESDFAGVPFTVPTQINLTAITSRLNSYAMTNIITGSVIIEDANVI